MPHHLKITTEAQSGTEKCSRCHTRPRAKSDHWEIQTKVPWAGYCTVCREAHRMVGGSADEAVRIYIRKETDVAVLETAREMEMERAVMLRRSSVLKAIDARLRRIARCPHIVATGGDR